MLFSKPVGLPTLSVVVAQSATRLSRDGRVQWETWRKSEALHRDRAMTSMRRAAVRSLSHREPARSSRKIVRHSEALGGISRATFQMDMADLSHAQLMTSMELIASHVKSALSGA